MMKKLGLKGDKKMEKKIPNIYEIRKKGKQYCETDGSEHYKRPNGIEPTEFAMANGTFEDFAITNIIKYANRFTQTRALDDLKKVSDYAHLLTGYELDKRGL